MSDQKFVYQVKDCWDGGCTFSRLLVDKVTEKSVVIKGMRLAKRSDAVSFIEDFETAKGYALSHSRLKADRAEREFLKAQASVERIKNTTEENIETRTSPW